MKNKPFVIIILLGAALSIYGAKTVFQAFSSKSWSTCEGIITHSELIKKTSGSKTKYRADVQYEYTIGGNIYFSDKVYNGGHRGGRNDSGGTVSYYSKGKIVEVYFNPKKPTEALLAPGVSSQTYVPATWGIVLITFGALGIRKKK